MRLALDGLTVIMPTMTDSPIRYVIRPDRDGFSVCDIYTGTAAVIAMTPQTGMSEEDARHTAGLLNGQAASDTPPLFEGAVAP